jgi:hypothetical protein
MVTSSFADRDNIKPDELAYERRISPHIDCSYRTIRQQLETEDDCPLSKRTRQVIYDLVRVYTRLGEVRDLKPLHEMVARMKKTESDSDIHDWYSVVSIAQPGS